jgi:hypothetical protein
MIGELDVDRILGSIPSHLLSEWMAYDELEPQSMDLLPEMLATITSIYAEVHRNPEKRSAPFTADDFLPRLPEEEEEKELPKPTQTMEQQIEIAKMFVMASGGKDLRKDK